MPSTEINHNCNKCKRNTATAICSGCEQSLCTKDFLEHRQELNQQLESVNQEFDHLFRDINKEPSKNIFFSRIDQWEKESILRIQTTAESARLELRQQLSKVNTVVGSAIKKVKDVLKSSQQTDDFTEIHISKWNEQFEHFQ